MAKVHVVVKDPDKAAKKFGDIPDFIQVFVDKGLNESADRLLARMVDKAPKLTGAMSRALSTDGAVVGILDNDQEADVALFNEYSPNHQPFMRPALQAEASDFRRQLEDSLKLAESKLKS